jgi:glucose-6-phosphate isomerase
LTNRPEWKALAAHREVIGKQHLRELFAADRGERLTSEAAGLYLDDSKNRVTDETMRLLVVLAEACGVRAQAQPMMSSRRSTRSSTGWRRSPIVCAPADGPATPASASATS